MVFWGVQVKAGKPYIHVFDKALGRLHISQATLGIESSIEIGQLKRRSIVQCNVGAKTPVLLCSLLPDKTESCPLNLEFEEEDEVVFSVIGSKSVHLTGYYILGRARDSCVNDNYDTHHSDSYGEDIAETETEKSSNYDSEDEDEYESDFIDDGDLEVFPPSPVSNTRVVIDEILEDEKPTNINGHRRRLKKKYQVSDSDSSNSGSMDVHVLESEDEDNVPISSIFRSKYCLKKICTKVEEDADKEVAKEQEKKKKAKGDDNQFKCLKRKADTVHDDYASKSGNGTGQPYDSSVPSIEIGPGNSVKPKKKKKTVYDKEVKNLEGGNDSSNEVVDEDKFQIEVEKVENLDQDMLVRHEAHEEVDSSIPSVLSIDVGLERGVKPKKTKKVYAKVVKTLEVGNDSSMEIVNVDKFQIEVEKVENVDQDTLVRHEAHEEVDSSIPSVLSIDVGLEGGVKPKKKKKVYAKEVKNLEMGNDSSKEVINEDKFQIEVEKIENVDQDMLVRHEGHEEIDSAIPSLPSIYVGHEDGVKPKKKKKVYAKEVKTLERGNDSSKEVIDKDKFQIEVEKIENVDQDMLVRHEGHEEMDSAIQSLPSIDVGHEDGLKPKKKKKKVYAKEVKTLERENDSSNEVVSEDKFQIEVEKIENMDQVMLVRHEAHEEVDSSIPSMLSIDVGHEDGLKPKKKKKNKGQAKKNDVGDEAELLPPNNDNKGVAVEIEYVAAENYSDEKKKKMKKKNKIQGSNEMNANTKESILKEKRGPSSIETENNKKAEGDPSPAMTLSNELMIINEEFEVGKADGEEAATMKKATKTRPPVPTSMGHGSHGAGEKVLWNSLF